MYLQTVIKDRQNDFRMLCARNQIATLYAFGSAVGAGFDLEKSDVDLLVKLNISDPLLYGEVLLKLWDDLELFLDRKVDLLTNESVQNPYLKQSIEESKVLIYDAAAEEIPV